MDFNIDLHGLEDVLSGETSVSTEVPVFSIPDTVSLSDIENTIENNIENTGISYTSDVHQIGKDAYKENTRGVSSLSVEDIRRFYADDKTDDTPHKQSQGIEPKKDTTESTSKSHSLTVEEIRKIYGIQEEKKEEPVTVNKEPVKDTPSFTAEDIRRIYGIQEEKKEESVVDNKTKESSKQSSLSVDEIRKIYGISRDEEDNSEEEYEEEDIEEEDYDEYEEEDYSDDEVDEEDYEDEELDDEDYEEDEEDYSDDEVDEDDYDEEDYSDDELDEEDYEDEEDYSDDEVDDEEYEEIVKNEKPVLEKARIVKSIEKPEIDINSIKLQQDKHEELQRMPVVENIRPQQAIASMNNNDSLSESSQQKVEKTKACYEASTVINNVVKTMPKINYSSLEVSKLYNFVAVFMKRNGVKSSGIKKSVLVGEFGADNIKRLITKSYLIQLADGTLTFSV
jgi:topoisomerase-4 subunit A